MQIITDILQIDKQQWKKLIAESSTATWFQTPEAYDFYASLPEIFTPFMFAIQHGQDSLKGIIVGYITKEKNRIKQLLTRRAIIIGGPLLSDDITDEELTLLLNESKKQLKGKAIYIESRNFNNYLCWKDTFETCGFAYQPHLNFHINCTTLEIIDKNIDKGRKRNIKVSLREGLQIVEQPTLEQVKDFYNILLDLYTKRVKTPLFPWEFFKKLYTLPSTRYLLVEKDGEVMGGTVCVILPNHAVYEWFVCGKDGVYKHIFPSSVATYAAMKYAAENNIPRFDLMGAGKPDEVYGVRDFKARFGGELVEYGRYLCVCNKLLYKIGKLGVKILKK